jgi:hypothetical protein
MRSCLEHGKVDVSKMDREALGSVLVEDVEELIKNKNFDRIINLLFM